jgi:hypothetical protein
LQIGGLSHQPAHLREIAPFDADLLQDLVDHWRLHPVAQRRLDHLVRGRAPVTACAVAAIPSRETVDMQNADAFDLLHGLDAFAHDAFDPVEQATPEQPVAGAV